MSTTPLRRILDRDFQKAQAREVIDVARPLLDELVNYGTNVLGRCEATVPSLSTEDSRPQDEHLVIHLLYQHVLEMLDSVAVLLGDAIAVPAKIPLRSVFEALLQLEWILAQNTVERAHAYLVDDVTKRIKVWEAMDASTEQGKQLRAVMAADKMVHTVARPQFAGVQQKIDNLKRLRDKKYWKEAWDASEQYPKRRWYAFFGGDTAGPTNLEQLAR